MSAKPKYAPRPPPRGVSLPDVDPAIKSAFVSGQPIVVPPAPADDPPPASVLPPSSASPSSLPVPSEPRSSAQDRVVTMTEPPSPERKTMRLASGEEVRRVNFLYPPDLIRRLKTYCATRDTDMTSATRDILDAYLKSLGF